MIRELLFQSLSDQLLAAYSDSTPFPFGSVICLPFVVMTIIMMIMMLMIMLLMTMMLMIMMLMIMVAMMLNE